MDILQVLVVLFATSSGLICVYALISSYLLYTSRTQVSKGEEFGNLVNSLFLTAFIGFIYTLWNLLLQLDLTAVKSEFVKNIVSNLLASIFFVMLAYLAFYTKHFSTKFGFRLVSQKINQDLKASVKPRKRSAGKVKR